MLQSISLTRFTRFVSYARKQRIPSQLEEISDLPGLLRQIPREASILPKGHAFTDRSLHPKTDLSQIKEFGPQVWTATETRSGLVAIKKGMTTLWDRWGRQLPVTVLQLEDTFVIGHRTEAEHGYNALVVGCSRVPLLTDSDWKAYRFHRTLCENAGLSFCLKHVSEFPVSKKGFIPIGTQLNAAHFSLGQLIDAQAKSRDKGFQGVMRRWGFKGQSASHGTSLAHRSAGSIGCRKDPGKVWKGKKMAGQMGGDNVTVARLNIIKIDKDKNILYVKGSIPGPKDQPVNIRDTIYGKTQFDPYLNPPPFPTITADQLKNLKPERMWEAEDADPLAKRYNL